MNYIRLFLLSAVQPFVFNISLLKSRNAICISFLYITLICFLIFIFFVDIIEFVKTIANLIDQSVGGNYFFWLVVVLLTILLIYSIVKTLLEIVLINFFKCRSTNNCRTLIVYVIAVFSVVATITFASFEKINLEYAIRIHDIETIKHIENILLSNNVKYKLYVSKFPYLYKLARLNVSPYIMTFDGIALKNEEQIVITLPNDPHWRLSAYGYKYCKLSENTGIFVKGKQVIKILEKLNLDLRSYYFKKTINLEKLASLNNLKYNADKGILLESSNRSVKNSVHEYLFPGRYIVNMELHYNQIVFGEDFVNFRLTASNQKKVIYAQKIKKHNCSDNKCSVSMIVNVKNKYHGVEYLINPLNNNILYLSKFQFSKL